jgi:hypothetical protein
MCAKDNKKTPKNATKNLNLEIRSKEQSCKAPEIKTLQKLT